MAYRRASEGAVTGEGATKGQDVRADYYQLVALSIRDRSAVEWHTMGAALFLGGRCGVGETCAVAISAMPQ